MKLSCFLLLFFINMYHTRRISTPDNGLSVPLTRIPPTVQKLNSDLKFDSLRAKKGNDSIVINLHNFQNILYYGTPPQQFDVLFDTGSTNIWVFSTFYGCSSCINGKHKQYNHTNSRTYQQPENLRCRTKILYGGSGSVAGSCSMDTVSMNGIEVNNIQFLEVTNASTEVENDVFDGVMGLNYNNLNMTNIVSQLCSSVNQSSKFSFYLTKNMTDTNGGELTLCGIDRSKFLGELHYVDETSTRIVGEWIIPIQNISLDYGNKNATVLTSTPTGTALIDTGDSHMLGPWEYIKTIYKAANITTSLKVNCGTIDRLPKVKFGIGGQIYTLAGEDYVLKLTTANGTICEIGFLSLDDRPGFWVFGDIFLRKYYSVFDLENHRIGFAESIHD